MNDRAFRLSAVLAIAPFAFAMAMIGGALFGQGGGSSRIDPNQAAGTTGVVVMAVVTIVVWRQYVRWTMLRSMSTLGITGLLLAQALIWKPLISSSSCSVEIMFCHAQNGMSAGLWCMACGLIWWNGLIFTHGYYAAKGGARKMSGDAARMSVGFSLMALLPGVFFFTMASMEDIWGKSVEPWEPVVAYALSAAVAAIVWIALWQPRVNWTRRRKIITSALTVGFLLSPLCLKLADVPSIQKHLPSFRWLEMTINLFPLFAFAGWLACTAWVWREKEPMQICEIQAAVNWTEVLRCAQCGYQLTGLREARCPECGWATTLDELLQRGLANAVDQASGAL